MEQRQELEVLFAASALTGLLSSNSNLANDDEKLAKKAIKIGKKLADHYSPVETSEEEVAD